MAKKFVRGVTGIEDIESYDKTLTNVNDILSDGQDTYVHTKKGKNESYYKLTDGLKYVTSDNNDLITVTKDDTTNTVTLHPKHDTKKEQSIESTRETVTIQKGANGTSETTKVDTNAQKVLEHDNLKVGSYLTKTHISGEDTTTLKVSDDFINIVNSKQDKQIGKDFNSFTQVQINQPGNSINRVNANECNITFTSTLNSQMYQPQETSLHQNDFIIGTFKIKSDKDLDTLNIQMATPDGVFHNNIYYNLKAGKEYTLFFNTAKIGAITSQNLYLIFKAKNQINTLTSINITNFNYYVNEYKIGKFNFDTTTFNVSSDNSTPFYDIQNAIEFAKKIINVDLVPVTINLSAETFEVKMGDNLPYSISKGANKVSIIGKGSDLTKIIKYCTSTNQGKIIDAGGECLIKGFTIEYIKDDSYTSAKDYGSNPYCIHLDRSPSDESNPYTTKIEDVTAINEVNAPIGSGLRHNQKLVFKDVTLVNKTSSGLNGSLYVHAPNVPTASNCSFEAYDVYAIAQNDGYAVNMGDVAGSLSFSNIDCTFKGLGVIENSPKDYSNFKSTHKLTNKSFNNNNVNFNY